MGTWKFIDAISFREIPIHVDGDEGKLEIGKEIFHQGMSHRITDIRANPVQFGGWLVVMIEVSPPMP